MAEKLLPSKRLDFIHGFTTVLGIGGLLGLTYFVLTGQHDHPALEQISGSSPKIPDFPPAPTEAPTLVAPTPAPMEHPHGTGGSTSVTNPDVKHGYYFDAAHAKHDFVVGSGAPGHGFVHHDGHWYPAEQKPSGVWQITGPAVEEPKGGAVIDGCAKVKEMPEPVAPKPVPQPPVEHPKPVPPPEPAKPEPAPTPVPEPVKPAPVPVPAADCPDKHGWMNSTEQSSQGITFGGRVYHDVPVILAPSGESLDTALKDFSQRILSGDIQVPEGGTRVFLLEIDEDCNGIPDKIECVSVTRIGGEVKIIVEPYEAYSNGTGSRTEVYDDQGLEEQRRLYETK